jgi:hypothetical protein
MLDMALVVSAVVSQSIKANPRQRPANWSEDEIKFLRENAGILDDEEIGKVLGRSANGIKVFRVRQGLLSISRQSSAWITGNKVAKLLGIDAHKVVYWCRSGLLPARLRLHEESGREYFIIKREALKRWCVNVQNWVYFDWRNIQDEHIHRLCELRSQRWGDEWWNTTRVADYHGVDVGDVKRLIARGEIASYRPEHSLGGRNFCNTWRNHFVLRSEATRADLVFYKKRGKPGISKKFSAGFDAFVLKARNELHLEWDVISRMMKTNKKSCQYRYWRLSKDAAK